MMSEQEKRIIEKCEARGPDAVRGYLITDRWTGQNAKYAQAWLDRRDRADAAFAAAAHAELARSQAAAAESSADAARRQVAEASTSNEIARRANALALTANELAASAHRTAERAERHSKSAKRAAWVAAIVAIAAVILSIARHA